MHPNPDKPRHSSAPRGSRFIAWLALFFSLLALLVSTATFLLTVRDGQLLEGARQWLQNANRALHSRQARSSIPSTRPAESTAAEPPSALALQWNRLCDKLGEAESMIRAQDGSVRDYLANLKNDIEELKAKGTASGGQWLDQAGAKLKAIREQVAVDGPAAARRLRELAAEVRQHAQTLHRVNDALRAAPAPEPAAVPADPARQPEEPRP